MKNFTATLVIALFAFNGFGQNPDIKRTWHWYFGMGAGLDFSNGSLVVDTTSKVKSGWANETSFTLSDTCGNLLLYGYDTIYSKNHNFVYDLQLNNNLTQMLAIPQPGNDSIVYIFYYRVLDGVLYYARVNLNLNGGEGAIISEDTLLGSSIVDRASEKIAATHHSNNSNIWVVSKKNTAPDDKNLYAWLLTNIGLVTTPVISTVVNRPITEESLSGALRFTPDGSKMAAAYMFFDYVQYPDSNYIELYEFDNSTGFFSNPITINFPCTYMIAFSPDNSKLYASSNMECAIYGAIDTSFIIQYDISIYDSTSIVNSREVVYASVGYSFQVGLQLGPDGRLYVGEFDTTAANFIYTASHVGVIQTPNLTGTASNYTPDSINLMGRVHWSFPNFVDSYFRDLSYYDCSTDVDEILYDNKDFFQLWGNPAGDLLTLHNNAAEQAHLSIYDLSGKLILSGTLPGGSAKDFHMQSLSPGMYIINFRTNNLFISQKFIKR